jgi:hypothetical protein
VNNFRNFLSEPSNLTMSTANRFKGYKVLLTATALVELALLSSVSKAYSEAQQAFGFNAHHISGFPGNRQGETTGGGALTWRQILSAPEALQVPDRYCRGPFSDDCSRRARFPIR